MPPALPARWRTEEGCLASERGPSCRARTLIRRSSFLFVPEAVAAECLRRLLKSLVVPARLSPPIKSLPAKRGTKHQRSHRRHSRRDESRGRVPMRSLELDGDRDMAGSARGWGRVSSRPGWPRRPPLPSSQGGGGLPAPWENRSILSYFHSAALTAAAEFKSPQPRGTQLPRSTQVQSRRRRSA